MTEQTEFKIGDIVRMTLGEADKPGHEVWVREVALARLQPHEVCDALLGHYQENGWTVELIERPLLTKPNTLGWATVGGVRSLARLGVCGLWETYGTDGSLGAKPHPSTIEDFEEAVLIPKTLADEITAWADNGAVDGDRLLSDLADHLKGQDDE